MLSYANIKFAGFRHIGLAFLWGLSSLLASIGNASAVSVNWLDPLGYPKPLAVDIAMPSEVSVANKYYVDLSGGSGTTCSSAAPCGSLRSIMGKPGTTGGPAYIYIRGSGNVSTYNDSFYGSPGNEIVIKAWPGYTATITANSNMNSTSVHDIIWDGGPDLGIAFVSSGGDQYNFHVIADNITFYRIRASATAGGSMLFAVGDNRVVKGTKFINSEFYGCDQQSGYQCSAVYWGPGGGGGFINTEFRNNIVRNMGGDGLEVNPRASSSGLAITGNAFHNIGKQTCSGAWLCRPAITFGNQGPGNGTTGAIIANNVMWDTGSGCIWDRGSASGSRALIVNNVCYDYGKGAGGGGPNPQGISGYSDGGSATVKNNIIYAPNGTNPFDGSKFDASNNVCGTGKSCGTASQAWLGTTVMATDENNGSFMKLTSGSNGQDAGVTISSMETSYNGIIRPQGSAYDIGAFEFSSAAVQPPSAPPAPSGLTAQ